MGLQPLAGKHHDYVPVFSAEESAWKNRLGFLAIGQLDRSFTPCLMELLSYTNGELQVTKSHHSTGVLQYGQSTHPKVLLKRKSVGLLKSK